MILNKINIDDLRRVTLQLDSALQITHPSDLEISGSIQLFECAYELVWKILKKVLLVLGKNTLNNPR